MIIQKLGPAEQDELYMDLKIHDKLELELKRVKVEGGDEDGEQEAAVRDKLRGKNLEEAYTGYARSTILIFYHNFFYNVQDKELQR